MGQDSLFTLEKGDAFYTVPILESRRAEFDARHGKGSLEQLYADLAKDCDTFAVIGKKYGISRERIRQIYKRDLALHLPSKGGRERMRQCTLSRIHTRKPSAMILAVWRRARKFGARVELFHTARKNGQIYTSQKSLKINGLLCKINTIQHISIACPSLTSVGISRALLEQHEYIIFIVEKRLFFVVPSETLLGAFFANNKRSFHTIYLPRRKSIRNGPEPLIDYWQYKDAWHLLAPAGS